MLEFKTHSEKSFLDVKAKGVRDSKFEHYIQMQQYMRKMNITVALYCAVNKNNDEIYMELVVLDAAIADQFIERADKIVWLHEAPPKLPNASAGWFGCKWCDHRPVCHLNAAPDKNCRTCAYSVPLEGEGGQWGCREPVMSAPNDYVVLPKDVQLTGCTRYQVKKGM